MAVAPISAHFYPTGHCFPYNSNGIFVESALLGAKREVSGGSGNVNIFWRKGAKMIGFYGSRVIAAVKDDEGIEAAARSEVPAVFLLGGDIMGLERQVTLLRERGKKVFLHADLAEGIASDLKGIRFIAKRIMPDGLISTRGSLLKYARSEGLLTIQRLFLVDSSSLETGKRMAETSKPDFLEVLPGLVPKAITHLYKSMDVPIIAGGMIIQPEDMAQAVSAGAIAVSTSSRKLWEHRYIR